MRKANVFVGDEIGALRNRYPIDAMQSSQMNMVNRTGILISTAYESLNNPMTEEMEYCERVIDGVVDDETVFALLYKPDDSKDWMSDKSLIEANPLVIDIPENMDYLKKQRQVAIDMPGSKVNFLTKHMNIFVDGDESEQYIKTDDFKLCKITQYDWRNREVYIGVDLALSVDSTAISMVTYDQYLDKYICKSWAFIPQEGLQNRIKLEKVDYHHMKEMGYCFPCGDRIVSYRFIEDFVMEIPKTYGVTIRAIGYDKYNAISSVNRWHDEGELEVVEIKQHSSTLHPATKLLKECVVQGRFAYEPNKLLELHIANAREVKDNNLNAYVNKKKSTGKIDMVAATINAMVLWKIEEDEGRNVYEGRDFIFL